MLRAGILCALAVVSLGCLGGGCEGGLTRTDARFSTPERTVETLLASYQLDALTQDEVRARLAAHARFELVDRRSFEACFADLDAGATSEGLAGWVLGALAAGKDELRTTIAADSATVSPREGVRIVLRREDDGAWRIVLAESVPDDVRRGITAVTTAHDQRLRRQGISTGGVAQR